MHFAFGLVLLAAIACQPEDSATGMAAPPAGAPSDPGQQAKAPRDPVFNDRTKQAVYEEALSALAEVRQTLQGELDVRRTTELGFRCANLRSQAQSLASETDPLVLRVAAEIGKTCGLDVPLVSARLEVAQIERKRSEDAEAQIRGECLGLKLALGDVGAPYASNPEVTEIGGRYARYCAGTP